MLDRQPVAPTRSQERIFIEELGSFTSHIPSTKRPAPPLPTDLIQKAKRKKESDDYASSEDSYRSDDSRMVKDVYECPHPDCKREFNHKRNLVDHFRFVLFLDKILSLLLESRLISSLEAIIKERSLMFAHLKDAPNLFFDPHIS
jgi:hypothetical protein